MNHGDFDAAGLQSDVEILPDAISQGITFTCSYLNDYPFEIPMDKLSFYVGDKGVYVTFTCLCGRVHESTIDG